MNGEVWCFKLDHLNSLIEVYEREKVLTKKRLEDIEFEISKLEKEKSFCVNELEKNKV